MQILIIKFCGKKTPLVRRKRRRRRTIIHDQETGQAINTDSSLVSPSHDPEVQVHPVAIEAAVPFGKKVRKGENRKRKRSKDKDRKKNKKNKRSEEEEEGAVNRATRLAANLGQLIVNLPPEGTSGSAQRSTSASPVKTSTPLGALGTKESSRDTARSPTKSPRKRYSKSLSPEKTIAAGVRRSKQLAESVSSLSKSFEKLDIIASRRRRRQRRQGKRAPPRDHTVKGGDLRRLRNKRVP